MFAFEHQRIAPPSGLHPMNCMAIDSFYVKANGEIPCWCSPGEHHPITRLDTEHPKSTAVVQDVLNGSVFKRMRQELREGRLPFDYCKGCSFLRNDGEDAWSRVDESDGTVKSLNTLQVESSFLCNVDCPLCVRLPVRRQVKDPPHQLSMELFTHVIDDLVTSDISVREIWFSGRGEPLMNPDFASMVKYGKDRLGALVTAHTNGNFSFRDELVTCGLDEIEIAFDGVDQETYGKYRRGGKLERVAQFAKDYSEAKRRLKTATPELVWKMVLFEWNSSDQEISRAIAWADELGLDRVLLMNTDTPGGMSYRDAGRRLREIEPLVERLDAEFPGIRVEIHGYHSTYSATPEVDCQLRVEQSDATSTLIAGRLFNHLLETRSVDVQVRLQSERGDADVTLVTASYDLPERAEHVNTFPIDHVGRENGDYRLWVSVADPVSGELITEAACDFSI